MTQQTASRARPINAINLRVTHHANNTAKIFFNSPLSGNCHFQIFAVGEQDAEPIGFVLENTVCFILEIFLDTDVRHSMEVCFDRNVTQYVLEAKLNEV